MTICGVVLLLRLYVFKTPIVYTRHNLKSHTFLHPIHSFLCTLLERRVTIQVFLNESTENDCDRGVTILHGDYPDSGHLVLGGQPSHRETLLFFGRIMPYKGLDHLIEAFKRTPEDAVRLRIIGPCSDPDYEQHLQKLAKGERRIEIIPGVLPEEKLNMEIGQASLVILPYMRIYNSGAVFKALSSNCPVLVPAGPSMESLQKEIGESYIVTFDPPISAHKISTLMADLSRIGDLPPADLSRRRWLIICRLHERLYRLILSNCEVHSITTCSSLVRRAVAKDTEFTSHSPCNALPQ